MDDIEEWSGCSYIQLKEMSQDREQWRRKTIEWSSAVANRHRRWSASECECEVTGIATDEYTRHSVHVTQLYAGTTADIS